MTRELKTAGLLARPVWLIVRPDGDDDQRRALGPVRTLEKLRGLAEGVSWASGGDEILGFADHVPADCKEIGVDSFQFEELVSQTFEENLVTILWFDFNELCWDEEKELNADRWQEVGMLLEDFGIEFPGADAPQPPGAEEVNEEGT